VDIHHTSANLVAAADPRLYAHLQGLASAQRLVFFAGLPGTGKSLLSHQLTHLAHALGRTVHMLQWDVARPVFEASAAGQRYPVMHGITHGVIRKAAGLWARQALVQWQRRYPEPHHLLIGETPFVGHRFIDLARPREDAAEPLLRQPVSSCRCLPVPCGTSSKLNDSGGVSHHSTNRNAKTLRHRSCVTSGSSWLALPQCSAFLQRPPCQQPRCLTTRRCIKKSTNAC